MGAGLEHRGTWLKLSGNWDHPLCSGLSPTTATTAPEVCHPAPGQCSWVHPAQLCPRVGRPATAFPPGARSPGLPGLARLSGPITGRTHKPTSGHCRTSGAGPGPGCALTLACPRAWQDTGCSLLPPQPTVSPRRAREGRRRDSSGRAGGTPWRPQRAAVRLSMEPEPLLEAPLHPTRSWALPLFLWWGCGRQPQARSGWADRLGQGPLGSTLTGTAHGMGQGRSLALLVWPTGRWVWRRCPTGHQVALTRRGRIPAHRGLG